jgi:hypothetical protein
MGPKGYRVVGGKAWLSRCLAVLPQDGCWGLGTEYLLEVGTP